MRSVLIAILTLLFAGAAFGQQNLQIGQSAPEFAAQTLEGQPVNLKDLHGKVVVITFWSTRCAICHAEFPKLNQIVERYKSQDVVFLAVTMENEAKVNPYIQRNRVSSTIVTNGFGVVLKYANMTKDGAINMGFPSYFLIDKQGTITHRAEGWDKSQNLDSQISRLLAD